MLKLELVGAYVPIGDGERQPLTALSVDEDHIHGELRWTIDERRVPNMRYFGLDDVCLGDWWDGLSAALVTLSSDGSHLLDLGDQGDPAHLIERRGTAGFLSIVDSPTFGGKANSEWQRVPFAWSELVEGVRGFRQELAGLLESDGPHVLPTAWRARLDEGRRLLDER